MSRFLFLAALCFSICFVGCGGAGSSGPGKNTVTPPANNVATITANGGPAGLANGLFTSVTVCSPGTMTCATVSGILVDTGSSGLRILQQALPSGFVLPQQTDSGGNPIAACAQFADGFSWGPMVTADVTISGEKASAMPMQVINGSFQTIPASCSSHGPEEDTLATFGANGVLGVNNAPVDCGTACAVGGAGNPGFYYTCPTTGCVVTTLAVNRQAANPVALFATDNNGVIIEMPAITSASGVPSVTGSLVFGIGTQSNNSLRSVTILTTDDFGDFTTTFNGSPVTCGTAPNTTTVCSFTDTGSSLFFFADSSIATCSVGNPPSTFFCPSSPVALMATNTGMNGKSTTINFTVENAHTLFATSNFDFNDIGAPTSSIPNNSNLGFDWGGPFFFGRNVFVAIDNASTPGGTGPYVAY